MITECPICYEHFEDKGNVCPRLLPCIHTYCYLCLKKSEQNGQIKCPECRTCHDVPEEGIEAFPTNTKILDNLRDLPVERKRVYTLPQSGQIVQIEFCEVHNLAFTTQYSHDAAYVHGTCPLSWVMEGNGTHHIAGESQAIVQNEINSGSNRTQNGLNNPGYVSENSTRELVLHPCGLRGENLENIDSTTLNMSQMPVVYDNVTGHVRLARIQPNQETAERSDSQPESFIRGSLQESCNKRLMRKLLTGLVFSIFSPFILSISLILVAGVLIVFSLPLACIWGFMWSTSLLCDYTFIENYKEVSISKCCKKTTQFLLIGYGRVLDRWFCCTNDNGDGFTASTVCPKVNRIVYITVYFVAEILGWLICIIVLFIASPCFTCCCCICKFLD